MGPFPLASGLRFNDSLFSEPVRLFEWIAPQTAGIVAILARDSRWAPKPFQPLYFAEFGNGAHCSREPLAGDLYAAVLLMPFSTSAQRRALRNELIAAYNPIYQSAGTLSTAELVRRIEELEARHHEQSAQHAQIIGMLAHLCKLFEPQPVGPHRQIGFVTAEAY